MAAELEVGKVGGLEDGISRTEVSLRELAEQLNI